jgi:hypothetical protein
MRPKYREPSCVSEWAWLYFYQTSQIKPLLTFGVHPLKTELQRPDYDKDLGFIYKGKPLDSESITSVEVSIWNAGTKSIRSGDVLDPFRLMMPDGSAILSVRIKKISRAICGFELLGNQNDYKSGTCRLKWQILEPEDGVDLQIIYAGNARRDPKLEGVLEGQPNGIVVQAYNLIANGTQIQDSNIPWSRFWSFLVILVIGICLLVIPMRIHAKTEAVKRWYQERNVAAKQLSDLQKRTVPAPLWMWALNAVGFLLIVTAILVLLTSRPGPPFGW